jgi:spermidine/putrescine transport system substrate-binding protein
MKWTMKAAFLGAVMMVMPTAALADGQLNIYNWGNYTSPEMIKKFEEKYKVKVTVTDYDSNDVALAKIRAGGHGFDMVVPSANFLPIWINEGLLLEQGPSLLSSMAMGHNRNGCEFLGLFR